MYPGSYLESTPDKPAVVMAGTGASLTFRELEHRSIKLAHHFAACGLKPGDHVSMLMENNIRFFEVYWAAIRSGLYLTAINRYLQPEESAYILQDSGAKALISSAAMAQRVAPLPAMSPATEILLSVDGAIDGFESYEQAIADYPIDPPQHQPLGEAMLYSSGTTGRPKGIKRSLRGVDITSPEAAPALAALLAGLFQVDADTVYLSPAPLYHSAPLGFTTAVQASGGTAVVMDHFDPIDAMRFIDEYRITHSQWVPTMFTRMLKLAEQDRLGYDWSSHKVAIHAAAPCPVEVKRQMMDLWGPIIYEYYAGTEVNGFVLCTPQDWIANPGTVGKPLLGVLRICDELGNELEPGQEGTIYFEREDVTFEYHNDPEKTRGSQHRDHKNWSTLGDVGYVNDEGFLFLTDRKAFMIIAGGVNIYPQEIEDCLILHPKVDDVAVFGVPNADLGEEVKAIVQPAKGIEASPELAKELSAYAAEHLARFKVPRSVEFRPELPRLPTGKLYKRLLRDEYWNQESP